MRRLLAVSVLAASLALTAPAHADQEGAVAVCNWDNFTQYGHAGYNWHWWGCNLSLMGQHQCRGGPNTDVCYTVAEAKRDVRAFRAYTGLG
jgi:hypothetical protein